MQTIELVVYLRAIFISFLVLCLNFHAELQAGPSPAVSEISQPQARPTIGKRTKQFLTTPLISIFQNEELGESQFFGKNKILYLNESERGALKVQIIGGKLYDASGKLLNSKGKKFIYVMDEDGQIYISPFHAVGLFHHSSVLAGKAVAAAGEIIIKDGEVEFIDNRSGHYQPSLFFAAQILQRFRETGVRVKSHEWLGKPEHKTYFDKIFSELSKNLIKSNTEEQLIFDLLKTFDSKRILSQSGESMLDRLSQIRPTSNLLSIIKMIVPKSEGIPSNKTLLRMLDVSLNTKINLPPHKKNLSAFLKIKLKYDLFNRMDPAPSRNRGLVKFDPDFSELQMMNLRRNPDLLLRALQLLVKIQAPKSPKNAAPNLRKAGSQDCQRELIRLSTEDKPENHESQNKP